MRAFVTGGSGFLGRNLIEGLKARGHEVRALARSDSAAAAVEKAGAQAVRGDLDDLPAMEKGLAGCDVVFHSAADVAQWGDRARIEKINVGGTQNVLDAAQKAGVKKFVHVSTEAVLVGGRRMVNADESWPRPQRPIGIYPITKGLAEERVLAANSAAMPTVIVRPRFIWGKGDSSVLPFLIEAVKSGKFKWIGGGKHLSSTCHVKNVVHGMLLAAEKGQGGQIYFLTDGEPIQVRAFLGEMLEIVGVPAGNGSVPFWAAKAAAFMMELAWKSFSLKGEPPVLRAPVRLIGEEVTVSDEKARRELGYAPIITREQGLAEMRAT